MNESCRVCASAGTHIQSWLFLSFLSMIRMCIHLNVSWSQPQEKVTCVYRHRHQWLAERVAHDYLRLRMTSLAHLQQICLGMTQLAAPLQSVSRGFEWRRADTSFRLLGHVWLRLKGLVHCLVAGACGCVMLPSDVQLLNFTWPEGHWKCTPAVSSWLSLSIVWNTFLEFRFFTLAGRGAN